MNTLIAFATAVVVNQSNYNEDYNWPAILIGATIVVYIVIQVRKPTAYEKKEKQWRLEAAERNKKLQSISEKLDRKRLVVIIRRPDKGVNEWESTLIQLLTDRGAEVVRISKDEGDKIMYGSGAHDFTCPIVTGIARTEKQEGCQTKHCLDLRIWQKKTDASDVYLEADNITKENEEWLMFAFLEHIENICSE